MFNIIIKNGSIVTMDANRSVVANGIVAISEGKIAYAGSQENFVFSEDKADTVIDAAGCAVFPGLINTHTHSYQALIKGIACDKSLDRWLNAAALPAANSLTASAAFAGAAITAAENIHTGVTTIVDMYPRRDIALYQHVIQAYRKLGLDVIFATGYMQSDDSREGARRIESELESLIECAAGMDSEIMLAPFQVWNNSSETLEVTRRLAEKHRLHITVHAQEAAFDDQSTRKRHGKAELETLDAHGLLVDGTLLVHGVTATANDMELLRQRGVSVSSSPVCNMYLGSGFAPLSAYMNAGTNVCLSTEGAGCNNSNNMLETLKIAVLSQKALLKDASIMTAQNALEMSTINAARALGKLDSIGSLEKGKDADLFILDPLADAAGAAMHDPVSALAYSASSRNISTVIAKGTLVMEGGVLLGINERELLKSCSREALGLVRRAGITNLA